MLKKVFYISLLLLVAFSMIGCWSRREVEDLGIVSVIGLDRVRVNEISKYKISVLVLRPPQLGGGQQRPTAEKNPDWLVSEVGNSFYDAARNMFRKSPRTLTPSHNKIVIIGEDVAREGVGETLDFLQRHKDVRLTNWVAVSRGDAGAAMKNLPKLENTLAMELDELLTTSNPMVSVTFPVDLNRFTQDLVEPGRDAVAPVIGTIVPPESMGTQRGQKEPAETVIIQGLAVFRRDKLAGFLSPVESKGFLYVVGKAQSGIIPVNLKDKGKASLMMRGSKTEYKPTIKKGKLVMELAIKAEGDVVEVQGNIPVGDPRVLQNLQKEFSKEIRLLANDTISKAQKKFKADIFSFGKHIHMKYPEYWHEIEKDWYNIYPDLPVTVKVEGKLRRTAEIADPYKIK